LRHNIGGDLDREGNVERDDEQGTAGGHLVMEKFGSVRFKAYFSRTLNWTISSVQEISLNLN